jgi:hypothetical protein
VAGTCRTSCLNSQSPEQNASAEEFHHAINAERFEQQTFGSPAKQERRRSFDRHPTQCDVCQQQRELQISCTLIDRV